MCCTCGNFLSPRPVSSSTRRQLMTAGVHYCNKLLVLAVRPVCNAGLFTVGSDFGRTFRRGRASCVLASGSLPLFQEDFAAAEGAAEAQLGQECSCGWHICSCKSTCQTCELSAWIKILRSGCLFFCCVFLPLHFGLDNASRIRTQTTIRDESLRVSERADPCAKLQKCSVRELCRPSSDVQRCGRCDTLQTVLRRSSNIPLTPPRPLNVQRFGGCQHHSRVCPHKPCYMVGATTNGSGGR